MSTWQMRAGPNFGGMHGAPQFHAFRSIDANKDQKISKDEMLVQFARVDSDKDGQITLAEMMQTMMTSHLNSRGVMPAPHARKQGAGRPKEKKSEDKKPEAEAPKSEKPPEAKPADTKPSEAKSLEVPREKAEQVVAERPQVTSFTPVEAVRPQQSTGTNHKTTAEYGTAGQTEPLKLPSARS